LARLLARRSDGIFIAQFEQGEIGPDLFRAACGMGLEGLARSTGIGDTGQSGSRIGLRSKTQ
jgi:bifunctional non-homologous end joining protein LigD